MKYFLFLFFTFEILFASAGHYLQKADTRQLHTQEYWKLLLHMPADSVSEIDDKTFFLHPAGKTDAKKELHATIKALFDKNRKEPLFCRYPARAKWLVQQLDIKSFTPPKCEDYEDYMQKLDPTAATVVFPTAHINSPASMFGHTFLRIDSSFESKLLSHAVNYAAQADQNSENGFIFAVKGLFGGYMGKYSILPYYEKLKEYSDTEARDIWEYDLNLTEDELLRMADHIWELQEIYSEYYFFDENCSYNILWLIEIARPSVHLRDAFVYHVSPTETLFAFKKQNLIKSVHYRPSKYTKLKKYESILSPKNQQDVIQLTTREHPVKHLQKQDIPVQTKRTVLDAAMEYNEYCYIKRDTNRSQYIATSHNLAAARANLGKGKPLRITPPHKPTQGHKQFRIRLQHQYQDSQSGVIFGFRPAYHDRSDSQKGFMLGTQIEFFDYLAYADKDSLHTQHLTLLSLTSMAPRSAFFTPFSWRAKFDLNRDGLQDSLAFFGSAGAGLSYDLGKGIYHYLFTDAYLSDQAKGKSALGLSWGIWAQTSTNSLISANIQKRLYNSGDKQSLASFTFTYNLLQNLDVSFSYEYIQRIQEDTERLRTGIKYFF